MSSDVQGFSKPQLLVLVENNLDLEDETLLGITRDFQKSLSKEELREYAAMLKVSGKGNQEIADKLGLSRQWVTKYANPILEQATPQFQMLSSTVTKDTTEQLRPGLPIHTILKFTVKELKKETRTFGGWGSVEVLDSQSEIVSIEGLEAIMPTYMKRGAPIMFGHSNRHVGNVFKYQIKDKLVKGKNIPALWLEGRIHSDYKIDDLAWEALEYAHAAGLPILSLGATPVGHPEILCNDVACFKKYTEFQLYEFTIAELHKGKVGSNPEAQVEIALVKQKEIKALDSAKKKEIGQHLLQLKKSSALPETDTDLVNMMLATCGSCQDDYKQLIKQGSTEEEAKASLLEGLLEAMTSVEKETENLDKDNGDVEKGFFSRGSSSISGGGAGGFGPDPKLIGLNAEIQALQTKMERGQKRLENLKKKMAVAQKAAVAAAKRSQFRIRKGDEMTSDIESDFDKESTDLDKESADLAAAITKIDARLDKIERSITKTTANIGDTNAATADSKKQAPAEDEEEEEEEMPDEAAKKKEKDSKAPAALTFDKDFVKQMDLYLQQKGLTKVGETPIPSTSPGREITEIQKGAANVPGQKSKLPSREEMSEAMANWNQGGITKLGKKYGYD